MNTGFFEQSKDHKSMMRLLAFMGFCLGGAVTIWGLVLLTLAILSVLKGNVYAPALVGSLILLIGSGLSLAAGGEILKVVQQRSESKQTSMTGSGIQTITNVDSSGTIETRNGK